MSPGSNGPREVPLDRALAARLQSSFAALARDRDAFAARFYERLFARCSGLRPMFPPDLTDQQRKLVATLEQVVRLLETPVGSRAVIADLGRGHARFGARREHYALVVDELLGTMEEHAGPVWSAELAADWRRMLELVSLGMIDELGRG